MYFFKILLTLLFNRGLEKIALFGKLWFEYRHVRLDNVCNADRQFLFYQISQYARSFFQHGTQRMHILNSNSVYAPLYDHIFDLFNLFIMSYLMQIKPSLTTHISIAYMRC